MTHLSTHPKAIDFMYTQDVAIPGSFQITFHFTNGQTRSFNVQPFLAPSTTIQDIRQLIRRFVDDNWWILKTTTKTVLINQANVLSVEFTPPIESLEGEGILEAEFITEI